LEKFSYFFTYSGTVKQRMQNVSQTLQMKMQIVWLSPLFF